MIRVSTGIPGLNEILHGGWLDRRAYVVRGGPGTGKTTVGMHFMAAGAEAGEHGLFVSFDETGTQIRTDAAALGMNLENVDFMDLAPAPEAFREMLTYDIFSPIEVEKYPITHLISDKIEEIRPARVFIDGFSQFGQLATDSFHCRRLVQSCFRFVTQSGATLLVSCDGADPRRDLDIESVADGVLVLEALESSRRLRVLKFRGSGHETGAHVIRLTASGIVAFLAAA